MARWSVEQVLGHAPDDRSRKAALSLAKPGPWSDMGTTESMVWGKCQGSGKKAYQVTCDLDAPAFKCSCPSRKFPCKHGVALLLLWARNDGSVDDVENTADFAADWATQRASRADAKATKVAAKDDTPADPEAAAKRLAERLGKMDAGLEEFERWMFDLVRQGLAVARQQPYSFWDDAAARLVDGQLPGLADEVRTAGGRIHIGNDWPTYLLAELGRWYLAVQAWRRREDLPDALLADLRSMVGWARPTDEVLVGTVVPGRWQILGVVHEEDDRLKSQRTWLRDLNSGATHLMLDFAAVGGVLRTAHLVGSVVDVALALYPGGSPSRALFADEPNVTAHEKNLPGAVDISSTMCDVADQLAANPWLRRHPVTLAGIAFSKFEDDRYWVVDESGLGFPLARSTDMTRVLAVTGGARTEIFGELTGEDLHVATVRGDDGLVAL